MTAFLKNISWKELLLPMWVDLKEIYPESATAVIAANNVELANNEQEYTRVIQEITDNQSKDKPADHIVVSKD